MKRTPLNGLQLRKAFALSAVVFLITLVSCKKDGLLVPDFNTSQFSLGDTLVRVSTSTAPGDSVSVYSPPLPPLSASPLGVLRDEIYGETSASIYIRMFMSTTFIDPPNSIQVVDSTVLYLAWQQFYGFSSEQKITVYELTEDFDTDRSYYSNATMNASETPLGTGTMVTDVNDTFPDSSYVMRVKLSDELGTRIREKQTFPDMAAWLDFFKGLKITAELEDPSPKAGAIAYMLPRNANFKMVLYYHDSKGEAYGYPFYAVTGTDEGARFSHFENTPAPYMNTHIDSGNAVQYNFLGTMAGPRTLVHINHQEQLTGLSPISINKAELVIPYESPAMEEYYPPDRLYLVKGMEEGGFQTLPDYSASNASYFGGYLDEINQEYRFNIASTVSDMINKGQTGLNLYLTTAGSSVTANRLKLNSGSHPLRPMYLVITYTKQR